MGSYFWKPETIVNLSVFRVKNYDFARGNIVNGKVQVGCSATVSNDVKLELFQ